MPTYEYECPNCNYTFEVFQKITDGPLKRCPKCKMEVRRLIGSGAGIIFKGPGFYATDYARKTVPAKEKKSDTKPCPGKDKPQCRGCPSAE